MARTAVRREAAATDPVAATVAAVMVTVVATVEAGCTKLPS